MRHVLISPLPRVQAWNGGLGHFSPGWKHPRRVLPTSVLLWGVKGEVRLSVGGEARLVRPGRLVVLPAGLPHEGSSRLSEPASYFWIHFTAATRLLSAIEVDDVVNSDEATHHRLAEAALLPLAFDPTEPEPHAERFRTLLNVQEQPSYTNWLFQITFQAMLIALTEDVLRARRPPSRSSASSVVYAVVGYVAQHVTRSDLSVQTIASKLGLNPDYTGRRFKEVMGLTVGEYLLKERLKLAHHRLRETSDTVEAVAAASGFGSTRQFLRQFKAHEGRTPTEARIHHRALHVNST